MVLEMKNFYKHKKVLAAFVFLIVTVAFTFGLDVPKLQGRVNDYAGVIDEADKKQLNEYLKRLDDQTGIQIAVLTVPSLEGDSIESFSINVASEWKLGQEGEDNGALLVMALEEHDVRLEIGYGLEGLLTDAKCGLILRNVIIPEFKDGDYSEGILKGITNMVGIALDDEELVDSDVLEDKESNTTVAIIFGIIWLVFIIIMITSKGGLWKWIAVSNVASSGRHNYSSHSSSSFSGFSGGSSFSGGGGGFGGGGASGHW